MGGKGHRNSMRAPLRSNHLSHLGVNTQLPLRALSPAPRVRLHGRIDMLALGEPRADNVESLSTNP